MKIQSVKPLNRKRMFSVKTRRGEFLFPFAKAEPVPTVQDRVVRVGPDPELANEGFTYELSSGTEGSVHLDQVLDYNQDPAYLRDLLLYRLTVEARQRVEASPLAVREICRRLGTSPAQFYRLLDPTNYRKTIDRVLELLHVLECEVDLIVRP